MFYACGCQLVMLCLEKTIKTFSGLTPGSHQHQSSLIVVTVVPEAAGGSPAKYVILNMSP